jgi:hypothetical protein
LNVPKSLNHSPSGTSGSWAFHSANFLGMPSTAKYQGAEFINQSILLVRVVLG